jgi:hypothetical protein
VAAALIGPDRNGTIMESPAPFWVAQLPHHRDEMVARDYRANICSGGGRRTRVLPLVAEADGPGVTRRGMRFAMRGKGRDPRG